MEISNLDLTLSRINYIESKFNALFGEDTIQNNAINSEFQGVLKNSIKSSFPELPSMLNPFSAGDLPSITEITSIGDSKTPVDNLVKKYAQENNLDERLVKAIIKAESGFNPNAKSPVGAMGLMQLMPATARSLGVEDPFNPEQNIAGGTKYLRQLMDRFNGNKELAVAAYNAGPGAVNKYGGIPPYRETQNYVRKVLEYERQF